MKKFTILVALLLLVGVRAHAQTQEPQFPIQELGGCASKEACKAYCDNTANRDACITFAKAHTLVSPDQQKQIDQRARILSIIQTTGGPGGCKTEDACKTYCSDPAHTEECRAFAMSVGMPEGPKPPMNASSTQPKGMGQLKGPGGCASENDCKTYCTTHIDECLKFVMANIRACQMPQGQQQMPPGLKNNPNGIPDNFRNSSGTKPLPPLQPRPINATSPTGYDYNRSFLSNLISALKSPFAR